VSPVPERSDATPLGPGCLRVRAQQSIPGVAACATEAGTGARAPACGARSPAWHAATRTSAPAGCGCGHATPPVLPAPSCHRRWRAPGRGCGAAAAEAPAAWTWTGEDAFTPLGDRVDAPPLPLPPISERRRVVLVRHGQSTWNAEGRIQGSSDWSRLTDKGAAQAETTRDMVRGGAQRMGAEKGLLHGKLAGDRT
jgi:hypothetical protein